jgi:hypothetical protein
MGQVAVVWNECVVSITNQLLLDQALQGQFVPEVELDLVSPVDKDLAHRLVVPVVLDEHRLYIITTWHS